MFVGNDVVDLTDPETRLDSLHDRFAERIFTASEREAIFADARPDVALWTHWAAKQSAYKVLRKADPDAVFAHESFRVDFFNRVGGNRLMGAVEHDGRRLDIDVVHIGHAIHAVALLGRWPHSPRIVSDVVAVLAGDDPSVAVRTALVASVAGEIECTHDELRVVGSRPPRLERRCARIGIDMSLSHHGRLAGFAYAPHAHSVHAGARPAGSRPRPGA